MSKRKGESFKLLTVIEANDSGYKDIPDYSGYCPDCSKCGTTMGYSYVLSEFKCPSCGFTMSESDWKFKFVTDDDKHPPYACRACGGSWPNCREACSLFDD